MKEITVFLNENHDIVDEKDATIMVFTKYDDEGFVIEEQWLGITRESKKGKDDASPIVMWDAASLDPKPSSEDDESIVFPAVIAREIVQPYPDGKAYKPADELEKAYKYAMLGFNGFLPVKFGGHPNPLNGYSGMLVDTAEIKGRTENMEFVKNLIDPKTKRPMDRGIKCDIRFYKKLLDEQERKSLGADANRDVSIGFTFKQDSTPGTWRGQSYDYVQRDIFLQHIAGAISKGRCAFPLCGLGADAKITPGQLANDMWEVTPQYIRSGHRRPEDFDKDSFRIVQLTPGIKVVIACPQGAYIQGKCNTGTRIQSFLFDREKFSLKEAQAWFSKHEHDSFDYDSQSGGEKKSMGKMDNGIMEITADDGDVKDVRTGEKAAYWIPMSEASADTYLNIKEYPLTDVDMALTIAEVQKRIDDLYVKRDELGNKRRQLSKPMEVKSDPETENLWRKMEDIDAEIRAFKDLKAKMIVNGQIDSSCPICKEMDRLGSVEFAKRLGATFSLDSILKAVSDSPTPPQPKPFEEKKTVPPTETKTDNIDQLERSKSLLPRRTYTR